MQFIQFIFLFSLTLFFSACQSDSSSSSSSFKQAGSIIITDVNATVSQSSLAGTAIGSINISDSGDSPIVEMKIYGINAMFFDISPDGNITLSSSASLSAQTKPTYTLEVIALNANQESNRARVIITVVNTDVPRIESISTNVDENATIGTVVGQINIYTQGSSPITAITLLGTGASDFVVSTGGVVTLSSTASLNFNTKNLYSLQAIATNDKGDSPQSDVSIAINQVSTATQRALLMIGISFNNYPIGDSELNWHNKIFGNSYGEINHYYSEVSNGKLAIVPAQESSSIVNDGIIIVSLPINHPGNNSMNRTHLWNAVTAADPFINFAQYDVNSDGDVSYDELQVMFIVGGGETAFGDPVSSSTWAHASGYLSSSKVDNVTIGGYSRFGERQGDHFATIGVIVHELGHAMLKLPDLYDRPGTGTNTAGIGRFCLMAAGSWAAKAGEYSGQTPTHMSAWTKLESGWITPQVVNATTNNIEMHATHSSRNNIVKVPTDDPNQYFLIENRSPLGYDAGLYRIDRRVFDGGMAIWHIDESVTTQNDYPEHKLVDLEEANDAELDSTANYVDGTRTNLFYAGNSTIFDDTTTPNSKKYDGSVTNISVNNISAVGSAANEYIMYIDINR